MSHEAVTAYRARQRAKGLMEKRIWCSDENWPAIQAYAKGLAPPLPLTEPQLVIGPEHGAIKLTPDLLRAVLTTIRDHLTNQPQQETTHV